MIADCKETESHGTTRNVKDNIGYYDCYDDEGNSVFLNDKSIDYPQKMGVVRI